MSDDHIGIKVNGVLYVKLDDARKLREGWDKADERIEAQAAEITRLRAERDALQARVAELEGALRFIKDAPDEDCKPNLNNMGSYEAGLRYCAAFARAALEGKKE